MEQPTFKIPDLLDHVTDFAEKKVELIQLDIAEKSSRIISSLSIIIALVIFALFTILFAGLSLGWWLSELTGSPSMGFMYTTLVFLFLCLCLWLFGKKPFKNIVINWIIKAMLYDK